MRTQIVRLFTYCPWKDHLYELEQEMGLTGDKQRILYVLVGHYLVFVGH